MNPSLIEISQSDTSDSKGPNCSSPCQLPGASDSTVTQSSSHTARGARRASRADTVWSNMVCETMNIQRLTREIRARDKEAAFLTL